jgi:hypothetical protein
MTAHLVTPIIGLTLLATVTTACSTTTSATAATGDGPARTTEGSALAKETNSSLPKGELMGTGVGAAAGAIYDVRKRR